MRSVERIKLINLFFVQQDLFMVKRVVPTPENVNFPIQTSMYGASKLACEGLIQAYSEAYGLKSYIYRFVSILGPNYSHGHVIDFYNKLNKNKNILQVLGDGNQRKSYLHVNDCINAILLTVKRKKINIFNLGTNETITVKDSIKIICKNLNANPELISQVAKRMDRGCATYSLKNK